MKVRKRNGLYAVVGVLTTRTGNTVAAGNTVSVEQINCHAVDSLSSEWTRDMLIARPTSHYVDVGDGTVPDWSQLWPYGGDAA